MKQGHEMKTNISQHPLSCSTKPTLSLLITHTNRNKVKNRPAVQPSLHNNPLVLFFKGDIVHVILFQFYGGKERHILISVRLQG